MLTCIDNSHRLRTDRISNSKPWIFAKKDELLYRIKRGIISILCCVRKPANLDEEESLTLLNGGNGRNP